MHDLALQLGIHDRVLHVCPVDAALAHDLRVQFSSKGIGQIP